MNVKALFFIFFLIIVLAGITTLQVKTNIPPETLMRKAGNMLTEAQYEKAQRFAKETFQEATVNYGAAMTEWKKQNERFILFRDFRKVTEFAQRSRELSEKAIGKSRDIIAGTEDLLEIRIEKIGGKIKGFEEYFCNFPLDKKHRDEFTKSKLLYSESIYAYKNKNYSICKSKLDSVELVINDVFDHYREKLASYFEDYPKWSEMAEQTISWSKKNQTYAVVVDKFNRSLYLYKSGKIYKKYTIELGVNWVGDKMQQGDKSTPEGLYKVMDKKHNGQTKYHKALLLDYPNDDDKKRFALNKKNGIIKKDAKIGSLIEIHGDGGKGMDWTEGCIALNDADMDEVFKICHVGTKVTIVGSVESLNEFFLILR